MRLRDVRIDVIERWALATLKELEPFARNATTVQPDEVKELVRGYRAAAAPPPNALGILRAVLADQGYVREGTGAHALTYAEIFELVSWATKLAGSP